ncbi:MAG TPA: sulfatase-like hydrolase/transferase [Flavisolibacter sp.]|jgi:hypothetical protein|nr:sulfatase-like hydrolase/transferase [Flavisolibacter sp.]
MRKVKSFLEQWGLHAFLLPVFFVTHNYQQYYGLVSSSVAFRLGLTILLFFFLFSLLLFVLTKHLNKSLQLVTLFGFIILFFGVLKDFLQLSLHAHFLSKYLVLIPIIIISSIFLTRTVIKKKDFRRSNLFLNTLILFFLAVDISMLAAFRSASLHNNLLIKNNSLKPSKFRPTDEMPNVYFLVFDSYPGTSFLRQHMNYDNTPFNQKLKDKGFYIVRSPKSNYNRTAFSIASTLNFSYLKNIEKNHYISPKDYAEANLTIKEAIVPQFFEHLNYSVYNLSVFDIGHSAPIHRETFFTMPEKNILLYNTLPQRLKDDLLWNLLEGKYAIPLVQKIFARNEVEVQKENEQKNFFNRKALDSLLKITSQKTNFPKFVYAHFYLPHPPFFYDENGKENNIKYIMTKSSLENKDLFLSYLKYTNKIIEELIDIINRTSSNKSVIIVQSDHGFRDFAGSEKCPECFFKNYSAIYFPDKDYSTLYDTLSNINTFPILLNKYFDSKIPLQKDSCIFLKN